MKITLKQARRLTKKVVAENPPGTVRRCQYTLQGEPHCIVAVVLAEAGVTFETIDDLVGSINDSYVRGRLSLDGVHLTERAASYLHRAQYAQDTGNTWARALAEAEGMLTGARPQDHEEFVGLLFGESLA